MNKLASEKFSTRKSKIENGTLSVFLDAMLKIISKEGEEMISSDFGTFFIKKRS